MCVIGLGGSGGCWVGNVTEGPPGPAGLEMTRSEGRAPISQNQSSRLQGEMRKDKDASPHRQAHTHTLTRGDARMLCLFHTQTHTSEYRILCVIFKYGFREGLCWVIRGNYGFWTLGTPDLFIGDQHGSVFIHTGHRLAKTMPVFTAF